MPFRYSSFNRPLWCGFDPGQPFEIVDIQESDKLHGRAPWVVFTTKDRITSEHIYNLQLTDYEEIEEKNRLYKYAKTVLHGRYLDCVNDLIHSKKITTIEKIDYYAEKAKEK